MIQFINQSTFEHNGNQQGQTPNGRGYPTVWEKPHWHGDSKYNPHLRVLLAEPDGSRIYYDPVTTTYSEEHSSGYHRAILTDGVIENIPGKHTQFIGGGGQSITVSGQSDHTYGGHVRQNYQADHYQNYKGVHHTFHQQGAVSVNMGNETHEHHGNVKHRVMGENGAWGVGVGPGDGQYHDNAHTMTNKRIYTRAHTQGDMVQQTTSNTIAIASGKQFNTVSNGDDTNMQANGGNFNIHGDNSVAIESKNGVVTIKSASKIYLDAPIVWVSKQDLYVAQDIHCNNIYANLFPPDPKPTTPPAIPAQPETPQAADGAATS